MTLTDAAVIVFGLFGGYWVVSKLFFKSPPVRDPVESGAGQPRWSVTLGVPSTASAIEIRDAYQQLISKYHPDKVEQLGQELKDLAVRKSQEITAAYREGMHARGESP
jgi:hypothetical protein